MTDENKSILFNIVMDDAQKISKQNDAHVTALSFLLAAINAMDDATVLERAQIKGGDVKKELVELEAFCSELGLKPSGLKARLEAAVKTQNNNSFTEKFYMLKKLRELNQQSDNSAKEAKLTVQNMIRSMVSDPSPQLKSLIEDIIFKECDVIPSSFEDEITTEEIVGDESECVEKERQDEDFITFDYQESDLHPKKTQKETIANMVGNSKNIEERLRKDIFGQDSAISTLVSGYFQANLVAMDDKNRRQPRAVFLFAGPPGVGKTFLAEKFAANLNLPFQRVDMSGYSDKESVFEFCGIDESYKAAKEGIVTGFVRKHPKCVLLFDEIEKANISILHLFLQILDAGQLKDKFTTKEVYFKDVIIFFTTNAGRQLYEESETKNLSSIPRKVVVKALENDINPITREPFFPGAIISRLSSMNLVMFNHMEAHTLIKVAQNEIMRQAQNFEKASNISVNVDEDVYSALLFSEGSKADARVIRGRAETFLNKEVYELLRLVDSNKAKTDIEAIESINLTTDLERCNEKIKALFRTEDEMNALVFAGEETIKICSNNSSKVKIIGAQDPKEAIELVKANDIAFVLIDMKYEVKKESAARLNLEDVESPSREFFKMMRTQQNDTPVYLVESEDDAFSSEEKISFLNNGVREILNITGGEDDFQSRMEEISSNIQRQVNMDKLARENKVLTFETSQELSEDGKEATILLFDFNLGVAVDSEDAKDVLSAISRPEVRFDQVLGATDAKTELKYFVEYLKNPKKYAGTGLKAPKGVILYGPPGTGKTMLAKAMACESGVTFIAAEGNGFLKKYVGEGSETIHRLFSIARKYAPSVLFVDEIDAIAKERKGDDRRGLEGTMTAFLTEMDGFKNDPSKPVFVLAATNFDVEPGGSKSLDPALMRRFDRKIFIDLPKKEDRIKFLNKKVSANPALKISEECIKNIAVRSAAMSLADLESAVELALRSAVREDSKEVTDEIFEEAFETFNNGEIKKWDESQLRRVAIHEAGHAFIYWKSGEMPSYITVTARGNHGGYMQHDDKEGKAIYTKKELLDRICVSLGGRAAEIAYFGPEEGISTSASGDLSSATNMANRIVCTYGMDDEFGLAVIDRNSHWGGQLSKEIKEKINCILREQMEKTINLISENMDMIDKLVEQLIANSHLTAAEVEKIWGSPLVEHK